MSEPFTFAPVPRALLCGLLVLGLNLLSASAWAEKADRDKPMNAEADSLRYDDVKQTSVFTGNVVITKGTMIIRGDRVEVRQDNEGYQFGTASGSSSKRAFFRQKRDMGDEWIEGEGEVIVYDGKADTVTFTRNATMRRLRGAAVADETHGAQIVYNNSSETYSVSSGTASGSLASGNPGGRVRAILSPRPAAGAASAPATSPASGTPLRPSTSLEDKK